MQINHVKCAAQELESIVTMAAKFVPLAVHSSGDQCRQGIVRSSSAREDEEGVRSH